MEILIFLIFLLLLALPEILILLGAFIVLIFYGIGEFILRLFGKSFEDKKDGK